MNFSQILLIHPWLKLAMWPHGHGGLTTLSLFHLYFTSVVINAN